MGDDCGQRLRRLWSDVEDHVVIGDFIDALHRGDGGGRELLGADDVGRQRYLDFGHHGLGLVDEVVFGERFADLLARSEQEGVGDAAADDQLIDLVGEAFEDGQLGRHLGATDDGHQRPRRLGEGLGQGFEFGGDAGAGAGDLGELAHAVGRGLGTVGGAEGVHHPDVAQRGHLLGEFFVALLLALVAAAVLQHHDFAGLDLEAAVDPVLDEADGLAEQLGHALGDRCERILGLEFAFGGAAEVGGDHYRRALFEGVADARQRGADAGVVGDGERVVLRDVEVGADEDAQPFDVKVGETLESHGGVRCTK